MHLSQQYYGHHFVAGTLFIMLIVGGMVSYLAFIYTQSFFIVADKEKNIPVYAPPGIVVAGEIKGELPDNHGYIFQETLPDGRVINFAAVYEEPTTTKLTGSVVIHGKYFGNNCAYRSSFEGRCVNAIGIETIDARVSASSTASQEPVVVTLPRAGGAISSPLAVWGKARGSWFFEASFPLVLTDWDGKIIAQSFAKAEGEWMTTDYVPFSGTLTFEKPSYGTRGFLILKKDNPSGLPELDDSREIPVVFQ